MPDGRQKRTEVVSEIVFLGKLVERVAAGKIRVPRFQRAFVWKQPDLSALLDSVLRGFPIGSILVWETDRDIESTPCIGPVEIGSRPDGVVGYILDGQQRVSTLAGTLRLMGGTASIVDQIEWRVYYDLDEQAFVDHRKAVKDSVGGHDSARDPDPRYFPVRSLLNTAGFFEACRRIQEGQVDDEHSRRRLDAADRLASAFRDYQLPLVSIREADLESAVTVFARLNRTGRRMAEDELVSALTYQEGQFHLASMLDEFKAELKKKGFGGLDRVFLLRSVLAALELDIYAKDWADLMVKPAVRGRLPEGFEAAREGIGRALDMLRGLGVTSDRLLPYGLQLVLLGEFHRICPRADGGDGRAAQALVLGDIVHWLVRRCQYGAQAKRASGGDPRTLQGGEAQTFDVVDPGHAGAAVSRSLRYSKRTRAGIPAVPCVSSSLLASRRRRAEPRYALLSRLGSEASSLRSGQTPTQARPPFPVRRTACSWKMGHIGQALGALSALG